MAKQINYQYEPKVGAIWNILLSETPIVSLSIKDEDSDNYIAILDLGREGKQTTHINKINCSITSIIYKDIQGNFIKKENIIEKAIKIPFSEKRSRAHRVRSPIGVFSVADETQLKRRSTIAISDYPVHNLASLIQSINVCNENNNKKMNKFYFIVQSKIFLFTLKYIGQEKIDTNDFMNGNFSTFIENNKISADVYEVILKKKEQEFRVAKYWALSNKKTSNDNITFSNKLLKFSYYKDQETQE